jgi:hypothetical protein
MKASRLVLLATCMLAWTAAPGRAMAADEPEAIPYRQSRDDAWWTGPILAAGANTLPKGHALVEPYLFRVTSRGRYDENGTKQPGARNHSYGSFTYLLYGLVDDFTVGVIPRFSYNDVSVGQDSSGVRPGDFSLQASYQLTRYRDGGRMPSVSVVLQETLPTGKYDRLGDRPSDGVGSGAYTTTLSLQSQYFLWMPNGRITRTRLNVSYAMADTIRVDDASVYGTIDGFRGYARPGRAFKVGSSWEYSATRNWVLALDLVYEHESHTTLRGFNSSPATPGDIQRDFGSNEVFTAAPAVEYNWNSRIGLIVGAVFTIAGRNTGASVAPVAALNMVF